MDILIIVMFVAVLFNSALTLALAGSVVKLIKTLEEPPSMTNTRNEDPRISPTSEYDPRVLSGEIPPFRDGMTNRPNVKNWDGISKPNQ